MSKPPAANIVKITIRKLLMKAHIVGSGLAGLAAAVYLIREGHVLANNITIYEAQSHLGGAMSRFGDPSTGYILPTGRVFEKEYRCTFDLYSTIPSVSDPEKSIKQEIEEFNARYGYYDKAHIIDANRDIVKSKHFGLSLQDRFDLLKLSLIPEVQLAGKRIDEYFAPTFFKTEFWYLWAPLMGCLPQHSAIEMRRFMFRFLHLLPDLSEMTMILRTRYDQYETVIKPIVTWLEKQGTTLNLGTPVTDVGFFPSRKEITANSIEYVQKGTIKTVEIAPDDIVLITIGSQVADLGIGAMNSAPKIEHTGRSWALWKKLAKGRNQFGNPKIFFGIENVKDAKWLTFTVTSTDPTFFEAMTEFTGSEPGRGGLMTFKDSNWLASLAIFHQPEFVDQPGDVFTWWGWAIYPDKLGNFVNKAASSCTGTEILTEILGHLKFENQKRIIDNSICIPCILPYGGSVWMVRDASDRPKVVPESSTNFAFIGQFTELPEEVIFTMEYSVRSAFEAVSTLLKLENKPPSVYKGHSKPSVLAEVLKILS